MYISAAVLLLAAVMAFVVKIADGADVCFSDLRRMFERGWVIDGGRCGGAAYCGGLADAASAACPE